MATIDGIEIRHPCSASWAAMEGDERARFCRLCSKTVYETTALTTCELEKMLDAPTPPCLRVHRDRGGRVLTRDRLAALAFVGLAACTGAVGDSADSGAAEARVATSAPVDAGGGAGVIAEVAGGADPRTIVEAVLRPTLGEPAAVDTEVPTPPPLLGRVRRAEPPPAVEELPVRMGKPRAH